MLKRRNWTVQTSLIWTALGCFIMLGLTSGAAGQGTTANPDQGKKEIQQDPQIKEILEKLVARDDIPGVVAGIGKAGQPFRVASAGLRKFGDSRQITIQDHLHLGSCTKAITATLIARMVEKGDFTWNTSIQQLDPILAKQIHSQYRNATLRQMLMHQSGMPANAKNWWLNVGDDDISKTRKSILLDSLKSAPKSRPGSEYVYSNLGYMAAGYFAAKKRRKTWEELVQEEVFEPLGIKSAGFGPPGTQGGVDQPWGHVKRADGKLAPMQRDNAPALGPAGTVYMSLEDWAKFTLAHTKGGADGFLKEVTIDRLHTPDPKSKYAMGWIVVDRPWGNGKVLNHAGSNTMWYALAWVAPETKTVYLAVTNIASANAELDQVIGQMIALDKKN